MQLNKKQFSRIHWHLPGGIISRTIGKAFFDAVDVKILRYNILYSGNPPPLEELPLQVPESSSPIRPPTPAPVPIWLHKLHRLELSKCLTSQRKLCLLIGLKNNLVPRFFQKSNQKVATPSSQLPGNTSFQFTRYWKKSFSSPQRLHSEQSFSQTRKYIFKGLNFLSLLKSKEFRVRSNSGPPLSNLMYDQTLKWCYCYKNNLPLKAIELVKICLTCNPISNSLPQSTNKNGFALDPPGVTASLLLHRKKIPWVYSPLKWSFGLRSHHLFSRLEIYWKLKIPIKVTITKYLIQGVLPVLQAFHKNLHHALKLKCLPYWRQALQDKPSRSTAHTPFRVPQLYPIYISPPPSIINQTVP